MQSEYSSLETSIPRKRVVIVAYALSPTLGSEYRSAWELVNQIAIDHDVTVLFGDSDALMGSFKLYEKFSAENVINFHAIKVEATRLQVSFAKKMLKMPWGLAFPLLLRTWHKRAFKIAQQLHKDCPFDVAHQLGPIGFRNPGYLWKLDCHTYWGPIGGAQYIDLNMIKNKWSFYFLEAIFRNLSVRLQFCSPYISKAARKFDRVSFATFENLDYFSKHFGRQGPIISDQGLFSSIDKNQEKVHDFKLRVIWAGTLSPRKNIDALIDIVKKAPSDILFTILGDGTRKEAITALAKEFSNVNYLGLLPRSEVMKNLAQNDVILLTSLSEANTAILFEAIENGCIPIAPRINGFVSVLSEDVAFLIDQGDYQHSVSLVLDAFDVLLRETVRKRMRKALQKHTFFLTWERITESHISQYK